MKYISLDTLNMTFEKHTEKAICFIENEVQNGIGYTSVKNKTVYHWIPKSLIKVAYNNEDDFIFLIPLWYYMKEIKNKTFNNYANSFELENVFRNYKYIEEGKVAIFE